MPLNQPAISHIQYSGEMVKKTFEPKVNCVIREMGILGKYLLIILNFYPESNFMVIIVNYYIALQCVIIFMKQFLLLFLNEQEVRLDKLHLFTYLK